MGITIDSEIKAKRKKRVAAYCRVSTRNLSQSESFAAQINNYKQLILANMDWEFAGIFADEGVSGANKAKRPEFLKLLEQCEQGKIDMILTKSISRFARNTVDCIETVRRLKEQGIGVYFEKENIDTMTEQSELFLTVLSAIAQEESMEKSKNIKWRYQKDFEKGIYRQPVMPYGYIVEQGKRFVPHPIQSQVVKQIFYDYLNGKSCQEIAADLTKANVPTYYEADGWSSQTVKSILKNERYIGDMLLNKYCSTDYDFCFVNQYYVTGSHMPLISRADFEKVQILMAFNSRTKQRGDNNNLFSRKINCGLCGQIYSRKKYKRRNKAYINWFCSSSLAQIKCANDIIGEREVINAYIVMLKKLKQNDCHILKSMHRDLKLLPWAEEAHNEIQKVNQQILELINQQQHIFRLMQKEVMDVQTFFKQSDQLDRQIQQVKNIKNRLIQSQMNNDTVNKTEKIIKHITKLEDSDAIDNSKIFDILSDISILPGKIVCFTLCNGLKIYESGAEACFRLDTKLKTAKL